MTYTEESTKSTVSKFEQMLNPTPKNKKFYGIIYQENSFKL